MDCEREFEQDGLTLCCPHCYGTDIEFLSNVPVDVREYDLFRDNDKYDVSVQDMWVEEMADV
jgi:copper chaperone CopZ